VPSRAFSESSGRLPVGVNFRPVSENDLAFLKQLYTSTRQREMELVDWTHAQKDQFLTQQFEAQHSFYFEQFRTAEFLVIEKDAKPIGRVYVDRREDEIRLIDIILLTKVRGEGLGKKLIEELLIESRACGLPVTIHVEKYNPAMRLYLGLGFRPIEAQGAYDQGIYDLLEWQPGKQGKNSGLTG